MNDDWNNFWKDDWALTRERFQAWWRHDGLILDITAPRDKPRISGVSPADIAVVMVAMRRGIHESPAQVH